MHHRYKVEKVLEYVRQHPGCSAQDVALSIFNPPISMGEKAAKQYAREALRVLYEKGEVTRDEENLRPGLTIYRYNVRADRGKNGR